MTLRLLKLLRLIDRGVAALEVGAVTVALLLMVGLYSTQVILRNTGHGGVPAFQLVVQHLVLWVAMLGASLCVRERKHIAIEVVDKAVSPSGRRVVLGLVTQSTFVVCLLLTWIAWTYVDFRRGEYQAKPNPQPLFTLLGVAVPDWWSLTVLPLGFMLMAARYLHRLIERLLVDEPIDTGAELQKEIEAYERRRSSEDDAFAAARRGGA